MENISRNTTNSKTTESNRFRLYFTNKLVLRGNKTISLANLSIYYTWQNIKDEYKNNKFKITAPTWNETFDLPDRSYTIADIQDNFLGIVKKHESDITSSEESPILIYPNVIKNRIVFKIKAGYKLKLLTNGTMKLLGDGTIIDQNKNDKNVPELENATSVLLHCNAVRNDHLQNSKLLYSFVPNNSFGRLLSIQPRELIHAKTSNSIFDYLEIWFTDQNNNPLKFEEKIDVSLVIVTCFLK